MTQVYHDYKYCTGTIVSTLCGVCAFKNDEAARRKFQAKTEHRIVPSQPISHTASNNQICETERTNTWRE